MKRNLLYLFVAFCIYSNAQINYVKQNIELISLSTPNFGVGSIDNRLYSGCWGWFQENKNREYAICGASNGTYFMDITNPATPTVCAYVPGKLGCTWREMKTYKNICYIISDDGKPNKFQIVDMQYLPDSVHIIHDGISYFEHAHTLWIDNNKMYVGSVTYSNSAFSPMNVYSLATPGDPVLLRELSLDVTTSVIPVVHDMFARNDTVYASCGYQGLYILLFDTMTNSFLQLGSYTGYQGTAYNHSSWLTENGKHLVFCDEVPGSLPIHIVDVQNLSNIQPMQDFRPNPLTTPHNPYLMGNDFAIVSCYQDGLYIYDISHPDDVAIAGYFDTHHQGGANTGNYHGQDYRGNWGAYPYLPSKIIIAQDMQNGVFLLDPTAAYSNRTGITDNSLTHAAPMVFPNPASKKISVKFQANTPTVLQLQNTLGQVLYQQSYTAGISDVLDISQFACGTYILSISSDKKVVNKKLVIYN